MKIVQVCDYTAPASNAQGAERIVERISKGLHQLGHEVSIKCKGVSPIEGVTLTDTIEGADIVHFHGWDANEYSKVQKPWVTTIHGYQLHDNVSQAYRSEHVVGVSKFAASNLNSRYYVWNCSDPDEFKFEPKKDNYFLWMASTDWGEMKGLFSTIELCKTLKVKLKIAGSGKNQDHIKKIHEACNKDIEYLGFVNGEDKVRLLQKAKALILFTRLPDACPVSVSEALMCGTPVLGSMKGSMPEIIMNNITGFTCESLYESIRAINIVDKIRPQTCRDFAEKNFSIKACAKSYVNIYHRVIDAGKHKEAVSPS